MAGSHSSWRAEDLLDLELASTNLGPGGADNGWGQGTLGAELDITYDMRCSLTQCRNANAFFLIAVKCWTTYWTARPNCPSYPPHPWPRP